MQILTFRLNTGRFGILSQSVKTIVPDPEIITIPEFSPSIKQVIKVRGELFGVISLNEYLQIKEIDEKEGIIFTEESVDGCFLVTQVLQIIDINQQEIEQNSEDNYFVGSFEGKDDPVKIIDIKKILYEREIKKMWSQETESQ